MLYNKTTIVTYAHTPWSRRVVPYWRPPNHRPEHHPLINYNVGRVLRMDMYIRTQFKFIYNHRRAAPDTSRPAHRQELSAQ